MSSDGEEEAATRARQARYAVEMAMQYTLQMGKLPN